MILDEFTSQFDSQKLQNQRPRPKFPRYRTKHRTQSWHPSAIRVFYLF